MTDLDNRLIEYTERFGEGFPTVPLAWGRSDADVVEIIANCLTAGKNVYDMGYLTLDPDVKY